MAHVSRKTVGQSSE